MNVGRWALVALFAAGGLSGCGADAPEPYCGDVPELRTSALSLDGPLFRDDQGRMVLLRGVNAGGRSKSPPFFPFPFVESNFPGQEDADSFDVELRRYVDKLEEWGMNVVRLPFSWEAVEPTRGTYDEVYVGRLVQMVEHLDARGFRVILDFHQDVFSRAFCGDGFPLWAVSDPVPEIPPIESCGSWFAAYLSKNNRVAEEFGRFWRNEDGLQDALIAMWTHVIRATAHIDGVIGFEPMNEPWEGTLETEDWAENYMKPLAERFADLVAAERPEAIAFFGSAGTDTLNGRTVVLKPDRPNVAFAPHFYDPVVYVLGTKGGRWNPPKVLDNFFATAEGWEVPMLIGEMGCRTQQERCDDYTRAVYETIDTYPVHATTWEYSSTKDDWNNEGFGLVRFGGEELPAAKEVVRVYPAAVAGIWGAFQFDRDTAEGAFSYTAEADGFTELVAPRRLYPRGAAVTITEGEGCAHYDGERQRVVVRADASGPMRVTIRRR